MKSLYDTAANSEMVARIEKLTPQSAPQWGKMDVAQMLNHCQIPLKVAFEEIEIKKGLASFLFGKIAKKQMLSDEPFKKNLPTFKEAKITDKRDFEVERTNLISRVRRLTAGPEIITKKPHPFFGSLTPHEWDVLQYKHLDHHLRQFGV